MPFLELTLELQGLAPEVAEAAVFELGALSVTLTDSRDDAVLEPAPGEVRLWPATRLQALFAEGIEADTVLASLAQHLGVPAGRIRPRVIADRLWEREWLKDFHAMRFGARLWVCPRHEVVTDPAAVVVLLDPADIVVNLHHAYERPEFRQRSYATFHTGPSATADIEGVLIHGAQGVRSLTVVPVPRPAGQTERVQPSFTRT